MNTITTKVDGYELELETREPLDKQAKIDIEKVLEIEVFKFLDTIDRSNPESEISKFNNSINFYSGTKEFFDYLADALYWFGVTDGIFNPFVVSVLDDISSLHSKKEEWKSESLFRMDNPEYDFPKKMSDLSTYISVDYSNYEITIHRPVKIDLYGISKGKFVDKLSKKLSKIIKTFRLTVGGDSFYKVGENVDPWFVNIFNPLTEKDEDIKIEISDQSLSVSGKLGQNKIVQTSKNYKLLNPESQHIAEDKLIMVIVKSKTTTESDVLAKTFFIANDEERKILSSKFPHIQRYEIDIKGKLTIF